MLILQSLQKEKETMNILMIIHSMISSSAAYATCQKKREKLNILNKMWSLHEDISFFRMYYIHT